MKEYELSSQVLRQIQTAFGEGGRLTGEKLERMAILDQRAYAFAVELAKLTPPGREQAIALTKLEECMMFVCNAIGRES